MLCYTLYVYWVGQKFFQGFRNILLKNPNELFGQHSNILFQICFPHIEYSFLCYMVGPCWLSILYIVVVYVNPKFLIYPPHLSPLVTISLFSMSVRLFLFCI